MKTSETICSISRSIKFNVHTYLIIPYSQIYTLSVVKQNYCMIAREHQYANIGGPRLHAAV